MPVSLTSQGRNGTCDSVPHRVAFRSFNGVGTLNGAFAAQWLAYPHPYQRFAPHLTVRHA
ncbi:hypothetical protein LDB30_09885 [Acidithiobacillus ferrooxidans]|nr:hypothetical protein LDB30_09885 [Acidithiobacillus ferrooxidans]